MRRRHLWLLPALLGLAQAAYHPQQSGSFWSYSNGQNQSLSRPETVRGVSVTPLQYSVGQAVLREDLLQFRGGAVYLQGMRTAAGTQWFSRALLLYPPGPLVAGQRWNSASDGYHLSAQVLRQEAVRTPAGRWNALLIYRETVTDGGARSAQFNWYVPGVGVVAYRDSGGTMVELTGKGP